MEDGGGFRGRGSKEELGGDLSREGRGSYVEEGGGVK